MDKDEFQVKILLYIMIKSLEEISKVDEEVQEELEDFEAKVQWKVGDLKAYMVFKDCRVTGEMDAEIDNPDLTMVLQNYETAKQMLTGEADGTSMYMAGDLTIEGNLQIAMQLSGVTDIIMDYMDLIRD